MMDEFVEFPMPNDKAAQARAVLVRESERANKLHGQLQRMIDRWEAQQADLATLRADCLKLAGDEVLANCEQCGAWLMSCDDFISGEDCSGCWSAMTGNHRSAAGRPCYAYCVEGSPAGSKPNDGSALGTELAESPAPLRNLTKPEADALVEATKRLLRYEGHMVWCGHGKDDSKPCVCGLLDAQDEARKALASRGLVVRGEGVGR